MKLRNHQFVKDFLISFRIIFASRGNDNKKDNN